MMAKRGWLKALVISLITLGLIIPIALYWWLLGRIPTLTARRALEFLHGPDENVVLVDVRDTGTFLAGHVDGAQNWPIEQIMAVSSTDQVPAPFQEKTLLFLCEGGLPSAAVVHRLQALGLDKVYNVRGGLQAWIAAWDGACQTRFCQFESPLRGTADRSFRIAPGYEQWTAVISAFGIKPLYMLLSLVVVVVLIRRSAPDLTALRWAFIFFFIGEAFCALNYLFFHENSHLFEYFHSYGMVVAFGFTCYAILEGLDIRVFKLSNPDKRCAGLELCGSCIKYKDVPCGARRLFLLLIVLVGILTIIPLLATPNTTSYNTDILGTRYNYSHPVILQIFEIRYLPIWAFGLFSIAFISLWLEKDRPVSIVTKLFFAAGMGALSFSMFRLVLNAVYQNNLVWATFWEELTELLYVIATGCVLWIFRRRLFLENIKDF